MEGTKKNILFIINPISGIGKQKSVEGLIASHLDHDKFEYNIAYTKCSGDGTKISEEAVKNHIDVIVAVGGDGSINEISKILKEQII